MLVAGQQGEAVVVDLRQLWPPQQQHGHRRMNHDVHGRAQALRPVTGSAQRTARPVQSGYQGLGIAAGR
ncbi:hypothetical protein D3C84_1077010 [compost metagenome]